MTRDTLLHGDCTNVMRRLASELVDFCLTDPPYLCNYRNRDGHTVRNDRTGEWLYPAFRQIHRLLKPNSLCVSFYGWHKADEFIAAWRRAGFRLGGHIVFRKQYASSKRFLQYTHEQAYLLVKGEPATPEHPIPDVLPWQYTQNKLHPTQKPVGSLTPSDRGLLPRGRNRPRPVRGLRLHACRGAGNRAVLYRDRAGPAALGHGGAAVADRPAQERFHRSQRGRVMRPFFTSIQWAL